MEYSQIFQIVATILGLIGLLSVAAMISRSSVIQQNNNQLRNAYQDARSNLADEQQKTARLEGENNQLAARVKVLEDMVTRRADIETLTTEVRTLTGVVRSDFAHLAPLLQLLVQGGLGYGSASPPEH